MINKKGKINPLVTVNILSFNRKDELCHTLTKVFDQDYKNIEVIVVDNASSDGTQQMVKDEFPNVNLIESKENIGIAGWNKGFEVAKGEYVLVLDDDSYPENGTIESGVDLISTGVKIAVVGFTIYNSYFNLIENGNVLEDSRGEITETLSFIGCGALIRKKIFLKYGGFEPRIFLYSNEIEFAIRINNGEYKILFDPNNRVIHTYSLSQRINESIGDIFVGERKYRYAFHSHFIYLYKNFSLSYLLRFGVKLFISRLYIAFRFGFIKSFFLTTYSLIILVVTSKIKRNHVSNLIQEKYNYGNLIFNDIYTYKAK